MAKKKKQKKKTKQELKKFHIFFFGVLVGLGLFWLPADLDFSPARFGQSSLPSQSVFEAYLPKTSPYIQHNGFVVSYDGRTRNPHWVYHKLTQEGLARETNRQGCDFKEDPTLPDHLRATKRDYSGSGFDRGHLCPAADCSTQDSVEDSFFMTNIVPQVPAFNRGFWKKLEEHVRNLTKQYSTIHAFSGPLYMSSKGRDGKRYVRYQVIGENEVAVPTHFFLLLYVELPTGKLLTKAFIIPNQAIDSKISFRRYSATVEEVERASGVSFTNILD